MTNDSRKQTPLYRFLAPRYWLIWIGLGLLRVLLLLPYPILVHLGFAWGFVVRMMLPERRRIARTNLKLCFPDMNDREREQLLRDNFRSLGLSFFELGLAWWCSDKKLRPLGEIIGLHHLDEAKKRGKGVLLLGAHFSSLDLSARLINLQTPISGTFRYLPNPLMNEIMWRGRYRTCEALVAKENMRGVLKLLKKGRIMWFLPDQAHMGANSISVPFFGVPAATNIAASRVSGFSGCSVVPCLILRKPDNSGYCAEMFPALENFPTGNAEEDAKIINGIFEEWIRRAPEQYLWIHRRFKGADDVYAR